MNVDLIIILFSILASAFFSAMELAFLSSNRLRIEVMKKNRSLKSRVIGLFFHRESTMIASLLMGNNIALVMYGIAAARVLNKFFIGFGISDAATFQLASRYSQGAIIGSAFIKNIKNSTDLNRDINSFIQGVMG